MIKGIILTLFLILLVHNFKFLSPKNLAAYDIEKSKQYANFASMAYCPRQCVQGWTCKGQKQKLIEVTYLNNNITQAPGYVGYSPSRNLIVISFRGSQNIQNWIQNLNFQKVPYIYCLRCEIHSGFYADYMTMASTLVNAVSKLINKYPTTSILATGHSLGGALSTIAGIELKRIFNGINIELHNYGCPRIGNVHLAKHIHNKIQNLYRVVHHKDVVPHLPPDLPEFQYHHSAYEIFFNEDFTEHKICSDSGEDRSCSNQYFPNYNAQDHEMYFIPLSSPSC